MEETITRCADDIKQEEHEKQQIQQAEIEEKNHVSSVTPNRTRLESVSEWFNDFNIVV